MVTAAPPPLLRPGPEFPAGCAPTCVRSCTMQRLPMSMAPANDSILARGWTRLSVRSWMVWAPVRIAESAMTRELENRTGAFGPAWATGGRIEWRFEEDEDILAGFSCKFSLCVSRREWCGLCRCCYQLANSTYMVVDIDVGVGVGVGRRSDGWALEAAQCPACPGRIQESGTSPKTGISLLYGSAAMPSEWFRRMGGMVVAGA